MTKGKDKQGTAEPLNTTANREKQRRPFDRKCQTRLEGTHRHKQANKETNTPGELETHTHSHSHRISKETVRRKRMKRRRERRERGKKKGESQNHNRKNVGTTRQTACTARKKNMYIAFQNW
jgi:hypothetical protein